MIQQNLDINIGKVVKAKVYHEMTIEELGRKQRIVLNCLATNPDGLTDREISIKTGLCLRTSGARRNELMHMGLVIPYSICTYITKDEERAIPNVVWGLAETALKQL